MHSITIQLMTGNTVVPKRALLRKWARRALQTRREATEITLRIVGLEEMTHLNTVYRHKQGATNVLSFPFHLPTLLGDIVICADVVNREAREQHKPLDAHWAHMVIHGICHLLGYDHETEEEATIMEAMEIDMMHSLGFGNPYATTGEKKSHE